MLAVVCAATLVLVVMISTPAGRRQLELSFSQRPQAFTELYVNTDGPVAETTAGRTTVRFGIRSHERMTERFDYLVTASRGRQQVVAKGSVSLRVGEKADLAAQLDTGTLAWDRVDVTLENRPEHISWLRASGNALVKP